MSWLIVAKHGRDRRVATARADERFALSGSVLWEIDFAALGPAPLVLFHGRAGGSELTLNLMPGDRAHVLMRNGDRICQLATWFDLAAAQGLLRLSLRWDCRRGELTLSAENLARGTIRQVAGEDAPAILASELAEIARVPLRVHPALVWHAVADHAHPVGPGVCMAGDVPLATARGMLRLADLCPGDRVRTRDGALATVRWCGAVEVPALGSFAPVLLKAPAYGRGTDLIVQPGHRLVFSGTEVDYLSGEEEVLIEARALLDGQTALPAPAGPLVRYHGLLCDEHAIIAPAGCAMETLCVGGLARHPDLALTTALADLARSGTLPVHRRTALRDAASYESAALIMARRAARAYRAA